MGEEEGGWFAGYVLVSERQGILGVTFPHPYTHTLSHLSAITHVACVLKRPACRNQARVNAIGEGGLVEV